MKSSDKQIWTSANLVHNELNDEGILTSSVLWYYLASSTASGSPCWLIEIGNNFSTHLPQVYIGRMLERVMFFKQDSENCLFDLLEVKDHPHMGECVTSQPTMWRHYSEDTHMDWYRLCLTVRKYPFSYIQTKHKGLIHLKYYYVRIRQHNILASHTLKQPCCVSTLDGDIITCLTNKKLL